jgi:predicted RNA-binding Zn-ribbon protein involved in translation (DUF1610 family)
MGKEGYGFSCHKCTAIYYPVPLHEALAQSTCPNCDQPVGSKADYVYWVCDHCGDHNDYNWETCHGCGR